MTKHLTVGEPIIGAPAMTVIPNEKEKLKQEPSKEDAPEEKKPDAGNDDR